MPGVGKGRIPWGCQRCPPTEGERVVMSAASDARWQIVATAGAWVSRGVVTSRALQELGDPGVASCVGPLTVHVHTTKLIGRNF